MNNLFILHTQYNLILGSGIANSMYDDNNILVLYAEFPVTDEILSNLKSVFSEIIVVRDSFQMEKKRIAEVKEIRSYLKKTKHLEKLTFERIFLISLGFSQISSFSIKIVPSLGFKRPLRCETRVDLPEPV